MRNFHSKSMATLLVVVVAMFSFLWQPTSGHGRLYTPPARGTMWRKGFSTPINYNDNEMFCGGLSHQISLGYRCGICGDPYDSNRPHEAGGLYATGTIAETYNQGQLAVLEVQLTANHKGWFEFKICPTNNPAVRATQPCLDQYTLQLSDGSGTKLYVEQFGMTKVVIPVYLPVNLNCEYCVLQWRYHAGNSWEVDENGTECMGCGHQEEFYGCADIRILPSDSSPVNTNQPQTTAPPATTTQPPTTTSSTTREQTDPQTTTTTTTTTIPTTDETSSSRDGNGNGGGTTRGGVTVTVTMLSCQSLRPNLGNWCNLNCNSGYCPESHCRCVTVPDPKAASGNLPAGCYARTPFSFQSGMDWWCGANFAADGICPESRCFYIGNA